jgi:hypothetical protein
LMGRQHRRLLADLTQGRLDERIAATPGTGEFRAVGPAQHEGEAREYGDDSMAHAEESTPLAIDVLVRDLLSPPPGQVETTTGADRGVGSSAERGEAQFCVSDEWTSAASEFDQGGTTRVSLAEAAVGAELGHQASFSGELSLFGVPDLLDFLRMGQRTGTLVLICPDGMGQVQLRSGRLVSGASPGCPRLVMLLQRAGILADPQDRRFSNMSTRDGAEREVVRELVRAGAVTAEQLRRAATERVLAALIELLQWTHGKFVFETCASGALPKVAVELDLDLQATLLEALRRMDEARGGEGPS